MCHAMHHQNMQIKTVDVINRVKPFAITMKVICSETPARLQSNQCRGCVRVMFRPFLTKLLLTAFKHFAAKAMSK